jgi:hypothetical protein
MIGMHIRVMHNLDRRLSAGTGPRQASGLLARQRDLEGRDGGEVADAEEVEAEELGGLAGDLHVADGAGDDGSFEADGSLADIVILGLMRWLAQVLNFLKGSRSVLDLRWTACRFLAES